MDKYKRSMLAVAFFCTSGWICNISAAQEESSNGADGSDKLPISQLQGGPAEGEADDEQEVEDPTPKDPARAAEELVEQDFPDDVDPDAVEVSDYDTVSLNVQDTSLGQVLQLLSIQGQRNIVPSPRVSGSVTANLYDVTFHEALDAILRQNGAGYLEKGDFIFVYTQDELDRIRDAERETKTEIVRLDYLTAEDASTFIEPLLSSAGSVAISGEVGAGFEPSTSDGGANTYASSEALVIRDYAENIEEILDVLDQMDTPPRQVLVEATILQANLTEELAFGVDMSILADIDVGSGSGGALGVVDDMISGDITETSSGAASSSVGNTAGPGGVKVGVLTDNVQIFVRALDQITDTVILANPKVMTLNRQRAEVLVGERVAYVSTTATSTSTTQTVEFLDTGTQLTLRPFVGEDGMIRMELKPSISSFELREASSGANSVTLPDEITQELVTNVMVRDGQTIVLGGLFKEETTIQRNQVPGLGDVPLIGNAFKGRDDMVERSEVIFLITPHIVKDREMTEAAKKAQDGIEMVRFGMREGLLPWSRSKMTAGHVRDALEYLEQGKRDKALWEVDMALNLDPRMSEARRLREQLTGERAYWPDRSLLEETVDLMVRDHQQQRKGFRQMPVVPDPGPTLPGGDLPEPPEPEMDEPAADADAADEAAVESAEVDVADDAEDESAESAGASDSASDSAAGQAEEPASVEDADADSDESADADGEPSEEEEVSLSDDLFHEPEGDRPLSAAVSKYLEQMKDPDADADESAVEAEPEATAASDGDAVTRTVK